MVVTDAWSRVGTLSKGCQVEGHEAQDGHCESEDHVHLGPLLHNLSWLFNQLLEQRPLRVTCQGGLKWKRCLNSAFHDHVVDLETAIDFVNTKELVKGAPFDHFQLNRRGSDC